MRRYSESRSRDLTRVVVLEPKRAHLAEEGIEPSVGSVGDSCENALAETIFGHFKAEVIRPNGLWTNLEEVEFATLEWVDWFNHTRLLEPIGDISPAAFEAMYYDKHQRPAMEVGLN